MLTTACKTGRGIQALDLTGNVTLSNTPEVVSNFTGKGVDGVSSGITKGPDGNLWFTNAYNDSIGRITTAGVVSNFTGAGIDHPYGITSGPDGALWFTNPANDSIGRITTAGKVSNFSCHGIDAPRTSRGA